MQNFSISPHATSKSFEDLQVEHQAPSLESCLFPVPSSMLLLRILGIYHLKHKPYIFSKAGRQEVLTNFSLP